MPVDYAYQVSNHKRYRREYNNEKLFFFMNPPS
jgi:hypothetical protein